MVVFLVAKFSMYTGLQVTKVNEEISKLQARPESSALCEFANPPFPRFRVCRRPARLPSMLQPSYRPEGAHIGITQENIERKELLEASASQSRLEAALKQAEDDAEHERSEKERVSSELRVKQEELAMKEKELMRMQLQVPTPTDRPFACNVTPVRSVRRWVGRWKSWSGKKRR